LIHIDTSRVDDTYGIAEELFKFCLDLNPNIQFEFGTEENVGVAAGAIKYKNDVAFAKNIPNIQFVVAQTGSLCHEDHQAGNFETATVKELVKVANTNGVKMKEHNADYLSAEEIRLRDAVGVHALNIAPQLGVVQTKLLRRLVEAHPDAQGQWADFATEVVDSGRWRKWTESNDREHQINVAGHYCFSSSKYQALVNVINQRTDWKAAITSEIEYVLDLYTNNLK
jgi:hypothetical protein